MGALMRILLAVLVLSGGCVKRVDTSTVVPSTVQLLHDAALPPVGGSGVRRARLVPSECFHAARHALQHDLLPVHRNTGVTRLPASLDALVGCRYFWGLPLRHDGGLFFDTRSLRRGARQDCERPHVGPRCPG